MSTAKIDVRQLGEPRRYPERIAGLIERARVFGRFRLVHQPAAEALAEHNDHDLSNRHYPDLQPAATFVDCWTCYVTWEVGK